jgi:uncharacterized cupin superfamily protein
VKPSDVEWAEAPRNPDETAPAARELEGFRSPDGRFTFGLWERDLQDRAFERPYDEVMFLLEGVVELTLDDGSVIRAEAGDILVTPKGTRGHWRSLGPTRKVWAVYEHPGQ